MTIEKAIEILDPETRRAAMREVPVFERIDIDQEACRLAVAALRAQQEHENPNPLTLDELRQMDGEPVFLVDLVHKSDPKVSDLLGGWIVFTKHDQNGFIPRGGGFFSTDGYGKTWLAYRSKKEV